MERLNLKAIPVAYDRNVYHLNKKELNIIKKTQYREPQDGFYLSETSSLLENKTPDSIFPNNWLSTHIDGKIFLYPMFAENRRRERRTDVISYLKNNFIVKEVNYNYDRRR